MQINLLNASTLFALAGETYSFIEALNSLKKWRKKKDNEVAFYDSLLELIQVNTCWKNGAVTLAS